MPGRMPFKDHRTCHGDSCPRDGSDSHACGDGYSSSGRAVSCESGLGGEQSVSSPHLTALPGHRWVGGTQGTAISASKALAAAP